MYSYVSSDFYSIQILFDILIGSLFAFRLISAFGLKKSIPWIRRLFISAGVCSIADIVCVSMQGKLSNEMFCLWNYLFYTGLILSTLFIFTYILDLLNPLRVWTKVKIAFLLIPFTVSILLQISNLWTHAIFYLDQNGVFVRGQYYSAFYVICLAYIFASLGISAVDLVRHKFRSSFPLHPGFYSLAFLIGIILQIIDPRIPYTNMGICVAFIMIFINRQDMLVQSESEKNSQNLFEALKRAEQANQSKTNFLFNMSHDIRTPMNVIIGFTRFLEKDYNDPEKVLYYQHQIKKSSELLLSLINNVLDMARIESSVIELEENHEKTGTVIEDLLTVLQPRINEKNLHIVSSMDITHEHILIDTTKCREIFLNLLSNAIKYTPAGGTITINAVELPCEEPGYAIFRTSVSDTGIGMSKEFLPTIFDEFSRERSTTQSNITGTGLGMAIVKKLVELQGGTITVESELHKGSTFTVTLKHRIAPSDVSTDHVADDIPVKRESLRGKRILLAEDNVLNAEITRCILEDEGIQVEVVADGVLCVKMLKEREAGFFDVILMDIQMPNMDGYETTIAIRNLSDRKKAEIPIIATTANAFEEDKKNAYLAGMNGHISKPINVDELMKVLSENLQRGER